MKRVLSLLLIVFVSSFGASLVGCEASGRVGDDDPDAEYRRTTTIEREDGEVKSRTEIRQERD